MTLICFKLQNILASACANEAENARHISADSEISGSTGALPSATSTPASSHVPQNNTNTRSIDRPTG